MELLNQDERDFLKIRQDCKYRFTAKSFVVFQKKTIPLKLSTQNIKNVRLISVKRR
jgi:hypothetical protein